MKHVLAWMAILLAIALISRGLSSRAPVPPAPPLRAAQLGISPAPPAPSAKPDGSPIAAPVLPNTRVPSAAGPDASPASDAPGAFQRWANTFTATDDVVLRAALLPEGLALAAARRAALKQLIASAPEQALAAAVPFRLRQELPASILDLLETRVSGRATLNVVYAKPPDGEACTVPAIIRFARVNDAFYYVHAFGRRQIAVTQPNTILIGLAVDDQMALAEQPYRMLEPEEAQAMRRAGAADHATCPVCGQDTRAGDEAVILDVGGQFVTLCQAAEVPAYFQTPDGQWIWAGGGTGGTGTPSPVNPATDTQGELRFLFMRVRFADEAPTAEPSSDARVRQDLDAVMESYAEMSYGTLQGRYAFTPTLTLPKPRSGYMNAWSDVNGMTALLNDAKAAAAAVVENGQRPYLPANFDIFAARWNGEPGGCCSYGGGGNAWIRWDGPGVLVHEWGHAIGLPHANFWNPTSDDPAGPGTHEEYGNHLDAMGSGDTRHFSAMFKAQLNWLPPASYWTITASGTYRIFAHDQAERVDGNRYGATLARLGRGDESYSYWLEYRAHTVTGADATLWTNGLVFMRSLDGEMLDSTPGSGRGKEDGTLLLGQTYSDLRAGIHLTPVARGVAGQPYIDLVVQLQDERPNHAPVNVITAGTLTPSAGLNLQLNAVASDPDGDPLAYAWDFGDGKFSLNNLAHQTKSFTTSGVYVVRCTVSDQRGGIALDSLTLRVGSPAEYSVAGRVTTPAGRPVANAMIRDGAGRVTRSGSDGTYTLARLTAGNHVLTAVLDRQPLSPAFVTVTVPASLAGVDFVARAAPGPGHGLRREHWLSLAGSALSSLTNSARYPNSPDGSDHVADAFEGPTSWAENYGARYRGYFLPPMSGGYQFFIASDDASELRLSRDEDQANAVRIAFVTGWTAERAWTANASQRSSLLQLAAGQRYYIEALHKEGNGGDHLAVGVDLPDGTQERPVPYHRLDPFSPAAAILPALVQVTAEASPATEGGDAGAFRVSRTGSTSAPLEVFFLMRGTALYGSDYTATGLRVTIPAGADSAPLAILPINDSVPETPESVQLLLADGPGYVRGDAASATLTLLDNDGASTVSIVAASPTVARTGGGPGRFRIRRTGSAQGAISVNLTIGGTAVSGVDYETLPNQVHLPAGVGEIEMEVHPQPAAGLVPRKILQVTVSAGSGYSVAAPVSASMAIVQPGPGFALRREWWDDLSAGTVSALTNDARFPNRPSGSEYLSTVFEGPRDSADNYGARYTALFVAPASGNYFFSIASDDGGELWLGTNALASSRRRIAHVNGYVGFRAWSAQSNQRSSAQSLVAGRRYYIEALHAEGSGGDHLSVGVQMPNNVSEFPLSSQWLEPSSAGRPLLLVEAPEPSASESGLPGRLRIQRTGEPTNAIVVAATLGGTAQFGLDYTLSPSIGAAPFWVRLQRTGSTVNASASPDGATWVSIGSSTLPNLSPTLFVGLAAATRLNGVVSTAVFDQVSVNKPDAAWTSEDVGIVDQPGQTTLNDGVFQISTTGSDIGGSADSCRFVHCQVAGDVTITARVLAQDASDALAKAGVMIRESLQANARTVFAGVTPRSFTAVVSRTTAGTAAQLTTKPLFVLGPGQGDLQLTVTPLEDAALEGVETVTLALSASADYTLGFSDQATVFIAAAPPRATLEVVDAEAAEAGSNSAAFRINLSNPSFGPVQVRYLTKGSAAPEDYLSLPGLATIPAGQTTALVTMQPVPDDYLDAPESFGLELAPGSGYEVSPQPVSALATLTDNTPGTLPAPWQGADLGQPGLGGGVQPLSDGFTIAGAGQGFTGTDDSAYFLSRPLPKESALTASLTAQRDGHPLSAAGLMIRRSLDPDAAFVFVGNTVGRGLVFRYRTDPGGPVTEFFNTDGQPRAWLRLIRSGDSVSAWGSNDGVDWTHVHNATFSAWPAEVHGGLTVTSSDPTALNVARFPTVIVHEPFALTGGITPAGDALELAWPDALGAVVLLSTASLTPPVEWTPVEVNPLVVDGIRRVTLPVVGQSRFYRLQVP